MPRYIVRRGRGEHTFSVWDAEKNDAAVSDGRKCTGLDMDDAFSLADALNASVQQQQQPQADDE